MQGTLPEITTMIRRYYLFMLSPTVLLLILVLPMMWFQKTQTEQGQGT